MPMTYTIDKANSLVRIVGTGLLTDEEMVECIASLRADPELEPDMNTLSDMRDIEVGFTRNGINGMVKVMRDSSERRAAAKAAIVVSSDVAYGMGRMLEIVAEGEVEPSFRIFRDMDSALSWLEID